MKLRDSEVAKNRDLTASAYDLEGRMRNVNDQCEGSRKEVDGLKFSNTGLMDRNGDCRAEIDAL